MNSVIIVIQYLFIGMFGLIGLLILLALVFGKRVVRQWDYEAEFRDADGREYAEFDIELSQIQKEEPSPTIKAKLRMRHDSLTPHQNVQLFLDDRRILEGMVEKAGRIYIRKRFGAGDLGDVRTGQQCRIVVGGDEIASEPLRPD